MKQKILLFAAFLLPIFGFLLGWGAATSLKAAGLGETLITDPCFEFRYTYWVADEYWSGSAKDSNPNPCNLDKATAAKVGPPRFGGNGVQGQPARVYQIVAADSSAVEASFSIWYISVRGDYLKATIYGAGDPAGPWVEVWQPLYVESFPKEWVHYTATTTLSQGYPYYKVEMEVLYTADDSLGFKLTGVEFWLDGAAGPTAEPTATSMPSPTAEPTATPTPDPCGTVYFPFILDQRSA